MKTIKTLCQICGKKVERPFTEKPIPVTCNLCKENSK